MGKSSTVDALSNHMGIDRAKRERTCHACSNKIKPGTNHIRLYRGRSGIGYGSWRSLGKYNSAKNMRLTGPYVNICFQCIATSYTKLKMVADLQMNLPI